MTGTRTFSSSLQYESAGANTQYDVGVVNLTGNRHADLLLHGPQNELNGEISPDGKWLAYQSDESKQYEIYVRPFPNVEGSRSQVSIGGGTRPAWARSGRELFYYVAPGKIMAVSVQPGTTLAFGTPHASWTARTVRRRMRAARTMCRPMATGS